MKFLPKQIAIACTLSLLVGFASAQRTGETGGKKPTFPGEAGGTNNGPGDTVPNNPGVPDNPNAPGAGPQAPSPFPGLQPGGLNAGPLGLPNYPPGLDDPTSEAAPVSPTSRPADIDQNSWRLWWHYNRWAFIEASFGPARTGLSSFYTGRGSVNDSSNLLEVTQELRDEIVRPALLQALGKGGRQELSIFALHALAKLRDESEAELDDIKAFDGVAKRLIQSGNQEVAEKALLAFGIRGSDRYFPLLRDVLHDTREGRQWVGRQRVGLRMRTFAAYSLGLLGERTKSNEIKVGIYEALNARLWNERVEIQAACLTALGLTAMPASIDTNDQDQLALLSGRTRQHQVLNLISFFEDGDQSFVSRSQAPAAIARLLEDASASLRGRAAFSFLRASAQYSKEQMEVQNASVIALGQLGHAGSDAIDKQIRDHLEQVAFRSNSNRSTRFFGIVALAEASARPGKGKDPFEGLEEVRKLLLQRVGRARGATKAWTCLALGLLERNALSRGSVPSPDVGRALRGLLKKTRSSETAGAIAIALGLIRDAESEELLKERMLETGEEYMRAYAALALGMLGNTSSIPALRSILSESKARPAVIENTAIALSLLKDQTIGPELLQMLKKSSRPTVQSSIASALGWIRDPRPVSELCRLLNDPRKNETGRAWTAVAIGRICDEDLWPWGGRISRNLQYDVELPTLFQPKLQNGLLDLP